MIDTWEKILNFELIVARNSYNVNLPNYKKLELIRTIEFCERQLTKGDKGHE